MSAEKDHAEAAEAAFVEVDQSLWLSALKDEIARAGRDFDHPDKSKRVASMLALNPIAARLSTMLAKTLALRVEMLRRAGMDCSSMVDALLIEIRKEAQEGVIL
ncbi:MAG: hypothetical protein ACPGWS_08940 [Solirubrobacterales bacterium]